MVIEPDVLATIGASFWTALRSLRLWPGSASQVTLRKSSKCTNFQEPADPRRIT